MNSIRRVSNYKTIFTQPTQSMILSYDVDNPSFSLDIFQLENLTHVNQAIYLANQFQNALVPVTNTFGSETLRFDVNRAIFLSSGFKPRPIAAYGLNAILTQENDRVGDMINRIIAEIQNQINVSLSRNALEQLQFSIANIFTNVYAQRDSSWLLWGRTTANLTYYSYCITFVVQDVQTGNAMWAMPLGFEITASASKEQVLGFTVNTHVSLRVEINGFKLVQPLVNS